jgi:hypothetical protein
MYNIKISELQDYKRMNILPTGFTEVSESTPIADNTYAWNETYKALHIRDASASLKGAVNVQLGKANIGDVIQIEMEVMNIDQYAKIAIDYTGDSSGNLFILESTKQNEFEKIGGSFIVTEDNSILTGVFGIYTADSGEYYIRNININVNKKNNISLIRPAKRVYTFNTGDGVGEIGLVTNYNPYTCSIVKTTTQITLTHDIPFTGTHPGIASGQFYSGAPLYKIQCKSESYNSFIIQFFDLAGAVINPNTIESGLWFTVIHHGYDSGWDIPM